MDSIVTRLRTQLSITPSAEPFDRAVERPVSPTDGLVVARFVAVLALAAYTYSFDDGSSSTTLAVLVALVALLQPILPMFGRNQAAYRHVQIISDLIAFFVFTVVAPAYFWLSLAVVASVLANYAVLTSMRKYVPVALLAVVIVAVAGSWAGVDRYERAVGIVAILVAGHGYMGFRTRQSMWEVRADVLHAVRAAGGFAHLSDLEAGRVIDVAGDVERVVGWDRESWMSMDHRDLVHPDDVDDFWIDLDQAVVGEEVDRIARLRRPDGSWVSIRDVSRIVMTGGHRCIRGFSIDVSDQQDGLARVTNEASTDLLTGLPNRRALLSELTVREHLSGHHLVLVDLNRFKDVNDTLGHDAGDDLLEVVAQRFTACLRPTDLLARLGGDEFAIIIDGGVDTTSVIAAVDRFGFEIGRPMEISGVMVTVSISAGIVRAEPGSSDPVTMLRHADISMYAAKRNGVVSVAFDDELERETDRRAALAASLGDAMNSDDLRLHFQPIVDVATGRVAGVEGLARWDHPDFGVLTPSTFLDVVLMSEQSGEFTRRMVLHGIAAAAELADGGLCIPVSVNLPVRVLEDPEFVQFVADSCREAKIDPNRLVFEIAERDIHDTVSITCAIDRMVGIGATISVDDFGAGHATFERLRWRNVDQLKLDGEAIRHAVERQRDRAILRSVLNLAAELGYTVVAEGVETVEQLDLLRTMGCPLVQGHHFAEAMPLDDVIEMAADRLVGAAPAGTDPA